MYMLYGKNIEPGSVEANRSGGILLKIIKSESCNPATGEINPINVQELLKSGACSPLPENGGVTCEPGRARIDQEPRGVNSENIRERISLPGVGNG